MKVNLIKILLVTFGFTMLYALKQINSNVSDTFTDATINVSNLSEENYHFIEKDLYKMRGINFCDVSLVTNIISLKINDSIVSERNIKNVLRKWGCSIKESSYIKIATIIN